MISNFNKNIKTSTQLVDDVTSAPIGAWEVKIAADLLGNDDRPTDRPNRPIDRPTNRQTKRPGFTSNTVCL